MVLRLKPYFTICFIKYAQVFPESCFGVFKLLVIVELYGGNKFTNKR